MSMRATTVKENVMKMVEANVGRMEEELRQWGAKLGKVVAKAEVAGAEVRTDYRNGIDDLKGKFKVAQSKFEEFKDSGTAEWGILETAWADLEAAFKKLGPQTPSNATSAVGTPRAASSRQP
jgi:hypothetical protein